MISTSQAWKDNQLKQIRSESDIRISFYDNSHTLIGTLTKGEIVSYNYNESGSISNDTLPIATVSFSCSMVSGATYDFNENCYAILEYGYLISGSWEWIQKGIYKIKNKEIPANGLVAKYTLQTCFKITRSNVVYYKNIDDIYKDGSYLITDPNSSSTTGSNATAVGLARKIDMENITNPSTSGDTGRLLKYVSYIELARQIALISNKTLRVKNDAVFSAFSPSSSSFTYSMMIYPINYLKKPEKSIVEPYNKITIEYYNTTYDITTTSTNYDDFEYVVSSQNQVFTIPPAMYCAFTFAGTYQNMHYPVDNTITMWYVGTETYRFWKFTTNVKSRTWLYSVGDKELKIATPLMSSNYYFNAHYNLEYANNHNIFYLLDLRIDPSVELFDKIAFYLNETTVVEGIVEDISLSFSGAFKGKIKVRQVNTTTIYDWLSFTNKSNENGDFNITSTITDATRNLKYSFDKIIWTTYDMTNLPTITIAPNQTIYLKGNNPTGIGYNANQLMWFNFSRPCDIGGNLMSLISETISVQSVSGYPYCFNKLFKGIRFINSIVDGFFDIPQENAFMGFFGSGDVNAKNEFLNPITVNYGLDTVYKEQFEQFVSENIGDFSLHLENVEVVDAYGVGNLYKYNSYDQKVAVPIYFSNKLRQLDASYNSAVLSHAIYEIHFSHGWWASSVLFDPDNIISSSTQSKTSSVYTIYTNNSKIANYCVIKRNEYTTVNIYHLNGSIWNFTLLDIPDISLSGNIITITPVANAEYYEVYDGSSGIIALLGTTTTTTYDITDVSSSITTFKVRAIALGYAPSDYSNIVSRT